MAHYGMSNGHVGLNSEQIDQQKAANCTFTLSILTTEDGKEFVLHAPVPNTWSSNGALNAGHLLSWLGFSTYSKCQYHGECAYKIIGELDIRMPSTAASIQGNEIRRGAAKRWAEKFDEIYTHARGLQSALDGVGLKLPGLR